MQDFANGIQLGENEDEYQRALQRYRGGLVLGFTKSRDGVQTVHRPDCLTISYGSQTRWALQTVTQNFIS